MTEIMEKFLKFEVENNLFNKDINGIKYWIYIRNYIFTLIIIKKTNKVDIETMVKKLDIKLLIMFIYSSLFCTKSKIENYNYDLGIFVSAIKKEKSEYGYSIPIIDSWLDDFDNSDIVFERPNVNINKKSSLHNNFYYTSRIDLKRIIRYSFKKIFSNKYKKYVDDYLDKLDNLYNVTLDRKVIYNRLEYIISSVQVAEKEYRKLLTKYRLKVLLTVCGYDLSSMIITKVAHSLGVKVIELQHGIMDHQIAYNYLNSNFENECLPDKIFVFGKCWKDNVNFPDREERIKIVGYPYLDSSFNKQKVKKYDKCVLFISGFHTKLFIDLAVNLKKILPDDYKILYKLHPSESKGWKDLYPILWENQKLGEISVIDNESKPLYYFFAKSTYQVGTGSLAIYEGLKFNLKTFIYDIPGSEKVDILLKMGYANSFNTAEQLAYLIQSINLNNNKYDLTYFWENDAKNKLILELKNEIIEYSVKLYK